MKSNLYLKMVLFLAALIFTQTGSLAQEKMTGKVILKIEKDGKTIVDTIFNLRNGQDPEQLKKVISQVAGEDVLVFTSDEGGQNVIVLKEHDGDLTWHMKHLDMDSVTEVHAGQKVMVYVDEEGDFTAHEWHMDDLGIDLDSLKAAHGGAKVMVMKDGESNITTKVLDNEFEWTSEDEKCSHGTKAYKIIITDEDQPAEDVYIIKTDNGKKIQVITETSVVTSKTGEEDDGQVKVIVIGDDEEKEGKTTKVIVKVLDEDDDKAVKEEKKEKK